MSILRIIYENNGVWIYLNSLYIFKPQLTFIRFVNSVAGIVDTDGFHWKEQKQFAMATLKQLSMKKTTTEQMIQEELTEVLKYINEYYNGKPFDPNFVISASITNIMLRVVFGTRHEYSDNDFADVMVNISQGIRMITSVGIVNHMPVTRFLPRFSARIRNLVHCRQNSYR